MRHTKAAVLGASGYTGSELIRLLLMHSNVEVTHVTADKHAGRKIQDVLPHFQGLIDLELKPLELGSIPEDVDIVFAALPHGKSSEIVKTLVKERGKKVVDLGADFRLTHPLYVEWYGEHPCPELIAEAAYGLSELFEEEIKRSSIVANPGCYPESSILALAPLLIEHLIEEDNIIIDAKSGVSGAGRSPALANNFCEVNEAVIAYKIGEHRHKPEIEEALSKLSGLNVKVTFTPHLIPMDRGILSTIYVRLKKDLVTGELLEIYRVFYKNKQFVRICPENTFPSTSNVRGSNFADIGLRVNPHNGTAIIVSVIDNLVKGASGQAVQNMNLMLGFPENEGLQTAPVFP
ncbi:MAG: N-acetyl-gamma-glutamyl-phosphate reductase [Thermodesulfobacteriota bacterium]